MEGSTKSAAHDVSLSGRSPKPIDIKRLVNQIFSRKGHPEVKNFPKEFADGSKRR